MSERVEEIRELSESVRHDAGRHFLDRHTLAEHIRVLHEIAEEGVPHLLDRLSEAEEKLGRAVRALEEALASEPVTVGWADKAREVLQESRHE